MNTYRDLKVWQLNQICIQSCFRLQNELSERYAYQHIWKQLFRAITSIGANLAEGQSSYSGKEFARYIKIAINSAIEVDYWLVTLEGLIENKIEVINQLTTSNIEVIKMLKGLLKSIETKRQQD